MKNEKITRLLLEMLELDSSDYVRLMVSKKNVQVLILYYKYQHVALLQDNYWYSVLMMTVQNGNKKKEFFIVEKVIHDPNNSNQI